MLLNIHPAHRSTLKTIQLLAVVKATHLKQYGIDAVLEPSIQDLQTLGTTVSLWCFHTELMTSLCSEGLYVSMLRCSACLVLFIWNAYTAAFKNNIMVYREYLLTVDVL